MSGFMLGAALLILLAVAFAVSALWTSSRRLAIALAIALPLAAIGLYLWHGTPQAIEAPVATAPEAAAPTDAPTSPPDVDQLVAELEASLAKDPSRWDGWNLLGNVRLEQGDYEAARAAFAKAHELQPDDNTVAVGYAEALMRTSPDRRFPPEAVALLERAARAEPPLQKGIFLLGMHRLVSGQPAEAADLWESLLPGMDPEAAAALQKQIAMARAAAGQAAPAGAPAPGAIAITVAPGKDLADEAAAGGVLFVFARPKGGGPPVAAKRIVVESWPVQLELSDADRPMSVAKLSTQDEVLLVARLSRSGNAIAARGDLESTPIEVRIKEGATANLHLELVRP